MALEQGEMNKQAGVQQAGLSGLSGAGRDMACTAHPIAVLVYRQRQLLAACR
jgi:hypothetical protein